MKLDTSSRWIFPLISVEMLRCAIKNEYIKDALCRRNNRAIRLQLSIQLITDLTASLFLSSSFDLLFLPSFKAQVDTQFETYKFASSLTRINDLS